MTLPPFPMRAGRPASGNLVSGYLRLSSSLIRPKLQRAFAMKWYHYLAYFFGGAFVANAIPHFVMGVTGHPFQSPFATPPGEGLSSALINVLWGFFNAVVGYVLL